MPDNRARLRRARADFRGRTAEPLPERVPGLFGDGQGRGYQPETWHCWVRTGPADNARVMMAVNVSGRTDLVEGDPIWMDWAENNPGAMYRILGRPICIPPAFATIQHVALLPWTNRTHVVTDLETAYDTPATAWEKDIQSEIAYSGIAINPVNDDLYLHLDGNPGYTRVLRVDSGGTLRFYAGQKHHGAAAADHYLAYTSVGMDRTDTHAHLGNTYSFASPIVVAADGTVYKSSRAVTASIMKIPQTGAIDLIFGKHAPAEVQPANFYGTGTETAANAWAEYIGGLAFHPTTGDLYFSDTYNYIIRRIPLPLDGSTVPVVVAGIPNQPLGSGAAVDGTATAVKLRGPFGLAFQSDGTLVFADETRLRKVTPAGELVTLEEFGDFLWSDYSFSAVAVDACDNIYYQWYVTNPDTGQDHPALFRRSRAGVTTMLVVGSNDETDVPYTVTGTQTISATNPPAVGSATFGDVVAMAFDNTGRLYLLDGNENVVRRLEVA